MAADESLLDTRLPDDALAPDATMQAPAAAGQSVKINRGTMLRIHVFSALFWGALFVMHTSQMMLTNDHEGVRELSWRAGMNLIAFLACIPLGWVIRRTLNWPLLRRVLGIGAACLPISVGYAVIGHIVWVQILQNHDMPYSVLVGIIIQSQYTMLLFLLWSTFCAGILYAAQLQERERSLLEAQALAHEAELKMLRYQINPHFLFNTLNAVSALIVTGQSQAADAMIGKLARFFRNALSRESTAKVTLAEDVRVQLEYLNIELTRFPDRLSWSTHIEPGLHNALVPHLILQPLFENAIKHGVARSIGPVEIRLTAKRVRGLLIVTVENNVGPNAPAQQQAGIGVGLANVARRLASFYGSTAGLTATRPRDNCYVVELRMPIELTL